MTTFGDLINRTEQELMGGDKDEMNVLAGAIDNAQTSITVTYDPTPTAGSSLGIDLEELYVVASDDSSKTCTVIRGYAGSTATAHNDQSIVYVNPHFSKWRMAQSINQEINDLSAPPNGLFQAKQFTLTTFPVRETYTVPSANSDLLRVIEIRYHEPGPYFRWIRMGRNDFVYLPLMPTDATNDNGFSAGKGIRIDRHMYPGRVMNVVYAAPFTQLTNLTDDVTTTGLPTTAYDIPPLGGAARLMGVREAKRAFVEAEVDTRRAAEVPPGSSTRAAQTIMLLLNERIRTELSRLQMVYGVDWM